MTIAEKAKDYGITPEALQKRLSRRLGHHVRLHDEFVPSYAEALGGAVVRPNVNGQNVSHTTYAPPNPNSHGAFSDVLGAQINTQHQRTHSRRKAPVALLSAISVGADGCLIAVPSMHSVLIYQEATALAGTIGSLFGVIVMLTTAASFLMSASPRWHGVSGDALLVILGLDILSIFLHYEAFRVHVADYLAIGFACVVATLSFLAMYLYRQKNSTIKLFEND